MNYLNKWIGFTLIFSILINLSFCSIAAGKSINKDILSFARSFIESYDLTKRDTHEYTPHILKKTGNSFNLLESSLLNQGFNMQGHIALIGYQEESVAPYYTNWNRHALEDEAIVVTKQGITEYSKNIFGLATGFLFKDAQWLTQRWKLNTVDHIYSQEPELFSDDAVIFQKHAFGSDYNGLIAYRNIIEKSLFHKDLKKTFKNLQDFWSFVYVQISKSGSHEALATQDILFSIDYIKALINSNIPINKLFIGPDITYPIEVLDCQKQQVTAHAQRFIKHFIKYLKDINHKKTAYIFCSFVDGVGKSTLLNNLYNYSKYQDNFDKYERCDNSSSQKATIYNYNKDIVLVDLPAQISHYALKPDGYVFVSIDTVKDISINHRKELLKYILDNKDLLEQNFNELFNKVNQKDKKLYISDNPEHQYVENLILFNDNLKDNSHIKWISFKYGDQTYLYNKDNIQEQRILVPLSKAHSFGLKELQPEHMLFSQGLSLPMPYKAFTDNLIKRLKESNIENICFVDFLSMYPRSSRENIRVNFILQYLKKVYKDNYSIDNSFYAHRVYPELETCHLLNCNFNKACNSLIAETKLRMALYDVLNQENCSEDLLSIKSSELEKIILNKLKEIDLYYNEEINKLVYNRLMIEKKLYNEKYNKNFLYQTLISFSSKKLIEYSNIIINLFSNGIDSELKDICKNLKSKYSSTNLNKLMPNDNSNLKNRGYFSKYTKSKNDILKYLRILRSQWYDQLSYLLNGINSTDDIPVLPAPICLKADKDNIYLLEQDLKMVKSEDKFIDLITKCLKNNIKYSITFNNTSFGIFDNNYYRLCNNARNTFTGVYAFGYQVSSKKNSFMTRIVNNIKNKSLKEKGNAITTTQLYQELFNNISEDNINKLIRNKNNKYHLIKHNDPRIQRIQLWVKMIATLELIAPDLESVILLRKDNDQDFIHAVKLLEKITLPLYYNIKIDGSLFDDYENIEPIIGIR